MASEYLRWLHRDVEPEKPRVLTPKERRANWWDYHGLHVMAGVVIALIVLGVVWRAAAGLSGQKPDYQIAYVGSAPLPERTAAALEHGLAGLGADCNGDGAVAVQLHQYIISADGNGSSSYAATMTLLSDLDSCESYFFLLEDPEGFQDNYRVLRWLDGSMPEGDALTAGPCALAWTDCPALADLPLEDAEPEGIALLSGLSLARRGFWGSKTAAHPDGCDALWERLTQGAGHSAP